MNTLKYIIIAITIFTTATVTAQTYSWQWAERGGGVNNATSDNNYPRVEYVLDVDVDNSGNHYFLCQVGDNNNLYGNQSFSTFWPALDRPVK